MMWFVPRSHLLQTLSRLMSIFKKRPLVLHVQDFKHDWVRLFDGLTELGYSVRLLYRGRWLKLISVTKLDHTNYRLQCTHAYLKTGKWAQIDAKGEARLREAE